MSNTIWKAALKPIDIQEVMLPKGARILCAREQYDSVCIWYLCDQTAELEPHKIAIVGTGAPAPDDKDANYLGTAVMPRLGLVLHVFEKI